MSPPELPYYLNGNEPLILGVTCSGFCLIQHQVDGVLSDPANSAYFKFNERWVHLCFEGSTIFWRDVEKPGEPVNDRFSSVLVLLNLDEMTGVVGSVLEAVRYWGSDTEVGASLLFSSGVDLTFTHLSNDDVTLVAANQSFQGTRRDKAASRP